MVGQDLLRGTPGKRPEDVAALQAALLAAAGQAIVGTDTEGAIFYWKAAAETIYG